MATGSPQTSARDRILAALLAHPGSTAGQLARAAVLGESTAAKALAAMEKTGAAIREPQPPHQPPVPPRSRRTPPATWRASGQPATPTRKDDLLTVTEVAGMWRVSKMTVYRMAHSGELGALRVGRSFRIPRAGVEAFHHPDALQATHYRPRRIETAAARCQRPDPMLTTT